MHDILQADFMTAVTKLHDLSSSELDQRENLKSTRACLITALHAFNGLTSVNKATGVTPIAYAVVAMTDEMPHMSLVT